MCLAQASSKLCPDPHAHHTGEAKAVKVLCAASFKKQVTNVLSVTDLEVPDQVAILLAILLSAERILSRMSCQRES